jgi:hypothetical protein
MRSSAGLGFDFVSVVVLALYIVGFVGVLVLVPLLEFRKLWRREAAAPPNQNEDAVRPVQWTLAGFVAVIAVASLAYKWLVYHRLEQTSALFVGLPALLSILILVATRPKSATGMACKATAVALLVSGMFLGEGFVCILMAAPLFFGIAILAGAAVDAAHRRGRSRTTMSCLLVLVLLPMSFEGVTPGLSFPREETVSVERVVPRSATAVESNLAGMPLFKGKLPFYLGLGFPRPVESRGSGLNPGDTRVVRFGGGEGKPGDLTLEVAEASHDHAVFQMNSDTSHVAHWLRWESARIDWREESPGKTRVRWTLHYRRSLDPAWYFSPWERYAVELAGGYLIDNVAAGEAK